MSQYTMRDEESARVALQALRDQQAGISGRFEAAATLPMDTPDQRAIREAAMADLLAERQQLPAQIAAAKAYYTTIYDDRRRRAQPSGDSR